MLAGCGEDQVAVRGAGIWARRLAARAAARTPGAVGPAGRSWSPAGPARSAGTWPGGWPGRGAPAGGAGQPAGPAAAGAAALAAGLAGAGARVDVVACDVAGRAEVAGLLARIAADGPPLAAVLHAAGRARPTG